MHTVNNFPILHVINEDKKDLNIISHETNERKRNNNAS